MQERRPYRVTDCPLQGPVWSYLAGSTSPLLPSLKLLCVEVAGRMGLKELIDFDVILHIIARKKIHV